LGGFEGIRWNGDGGGNKDGKRFFGKRYLEQKGAMVLAIWRREEERVCLLWRSVVPPTFCFLFDDYDDDVRSLAIYPKMLLCNVLFPIAVVYETLLCGWNETDG